MPTTNNPNPTSSPFEIVSPAKSKKAGGKGLWVIVAIAVFLVLSVVAGVLLVRQQQNVQEQAASSTCPGAEACPYASQPSLLRSCHPADTDGTVNESNCNTAGRVETCGAALTQYCCPSPGAAWTTDMTACASPTPSPTATATPTPSPTPSPTPNSCNGTCGSDSNCNSGLVCSSGFCRNPLCASADDCSCGTATATPTATPAVTPVPTQATQSSPLPIPVTGVDWPTVTGIGVGAAAVIISIIIAL